LNGVEGDALLNGEKVSVANFVEEEKFQIALS
jgi:hypothetical protein